MNAIKLYAIEIVFLLVFWTLMFRYIKPALSATIAIAALFAVMFILLELFVAEH